MTLHEETHTIRFLPNMWKQLTHKAAAEGTNNSAVIRRLVEEYLTEGTVEKNDSWIDELQEKYIERKYVTQAYTFYLARKYHVDLSIITAYCDENDIHINYS